MFLVAFVEQYCYHCAELDKKTYLIGSGPDEGGASSDAAKKSITGFPRYWRKETRY